VQEQPPVGNVPFERRPEMVVESGDLELAQAEELPEV
jgi:hypothetical protein